MEIRTIDNQPFIVLQKGKRELVLPPTEVVAAARKRIADGQAMLQSLASTRAVQQDRLEGALLDGRSTAPARKELATVIELEADQAREIDSATNEIAQVTALIDQHRADELALEDQRKVAALCKPLTDFLKDHQ